MSKKELEQSVKELIAAYNKNILEGIEAVIKIQKYDGNWNYSPYMHGLLNGMLLIESMVANKPFEPYEAPKKWKRRPWWKKLFPFNLFGRHVLIAEGTRK